MTLPKLYNAVTIKFSSLRNDFGEGLGVIFDCDEDVARKARRVLTGDGWKWQIADLKRISQYDYYVCQDQEVLDNTHFSDVEVVNERP